MHIDVACRILWAAFDLHREQAMCDVLYRSVALLIGAASRVSNFMRADRLREIIF